MALCSTATSCCKSASFCASKTIPLSYFEQTEDPQQICEWHVMTGGGRRLESVGGRMSCRPWQMLPGNALQKLLLEDSDLVLGPCFFSFVSSMAQHKELINGRGLSKVPQKVFLKEQ